MEADLPSLDQLRNNAAECIRLAEAARTSGHKSLFIEMAERWLTLAERGALRVVAPGCRRSGAAGVESPAPSSKAANGLDGRAGSAAATRLRVVRSWFDGTFGGNATRGTGNLGSWIRVLCCNLQAIRTAC